MTDRTDYVDIVALRHAAHLLRGDSEVSATLNAAADVIRDSRADETVDESLDAVAYTHEFSAQLVVDAQERLVAAHRRDESDVR